MTKKHTPGPWRFKTAANGDNGIIADGTGYFAEAFADIHHAGEGAREEALANARLISSAPDMFDAGLAMINDYQTPSQDHHPDHVLVPLKAFTAMQAVIAKVEDG